MRSHTGGTLRWVLVDWPPPWYERARSVPSYGGRPAWWSRTAWAWRRWPPKVPRLSVELALLGASNG